MANTKGEVPQLANDKGKRPVQALSPTGHHEQVDGGAASATSTETFYPGQVVRLVADANCNFIFGDATVTSSDRYLASYEPEYFAVHEATKISVLGANLDITVMK